MPNFPPSHVVANFPVTILHPITSNPMHQLQPGHTSCTNPAKKHQWARDSNRVKSALAMTRFSHILLSYMWCFHRIECSLFRSASCCILYSVLFFFFSSHDSRFYTCTKYSWKFFLVRCAKGRNGIEICNHNNFPTSFSFVYQMTSHFPAILHTS